LAKNIESIEGDQQMRRLNVVLTLATAIAAATLAANCAANAQAPKEWKIGALFPFSGPLAFLGQETFRGAEIASQIINEQGGINRAPIVWEKADAGTPAQARTEAERLANSGVKVVFGTNSSAQAIAASQVLEKNEVVFWEPGSAADEITTRGYKYTFRTAPPGQQWAYTLADFAVDKLALVLGKTKDNVKVAIKYDDGAFGSSIDKFLTARLQEKGVHIVANEQYSPRATDLSSLVLKIKDAGADIVLSTDYPNDAILFARQSKELGLPTKAILGWAGIAFPKFREDIGEYADGMMSINLLMDIDAAKLPSETQRLRDEFRKRYEKAAGHPPPAFAAAGFDGAWALFKYVLPKAGKYDANAIREAAMAADVPDGALTMGWGLKFSDGQGTPHLGQNTRARVGVTQWQDGKLVLVAPDDLATGQPRKP
jgi:branched-chain amino acid transport system substrate-binding protein